MKEENFSFSTENFRLFTRSTFHSCWLKFVVAKWKELLHISLSYFFSTLPQFARFMCFSVLEGNAQAFMIYASSSTHNCFLSCFFHSHIIGKIKTWKHELCNSQENHTNKIWNSIFRLPLINFCTIPKESTPSRYTHHLLLKISIRIATIILEINLKFSFDNS